LGLPELSLPGATALRRSTEKLWRALPAVCSATVVNVLSPFCFEAQMPASLISRSSYRTDEKNTANGWEIDRRLDLRETDTLLVKKYASCFFGTDLGSRLVAQHVDTLIITGVHHQWMHSCFGCRCRSIRLSAELVRETVGDRSASAHAQSLFDLGAKYADVVGLDDTVQYLKTFGHNSAA